MEQIESLLKKVGLLVKQEEDERKASELRGEQFNIFKVCGIDHYELQHSAIIAELLNPQGSHGQGALYLKLFMQVYGSKLPIDKIEFDRVRVRKEKWTEAYDGRMDICVENNGLPFVIIENKLYAKDQSIQLKKYKEDSDKIIKRSQNPEHKYEIVYLTLDGRDATKDSGEGVEYIRMSYSKGIIKWLDLSIEYSARIPLVRETLVQYQNHIKKITNMDVSEYKKQDLYKMLSQYPDVTRKIIINRFDYWWYVYDNKVKKELLSIADKYSLQFDDSQMKTSCNFSFFEKKWAKINENERVCISIETEKTNFKEYFIGIKSSPECVINKQYEPLNCFSGSYSTEKWPFGWKYLEDCYSDWSYDGEAIVTMADGRFSRYIDQLIKDILDELYLKGIDLSEKV